jgi:hypothetical protein
MSEPQDEFAQMRGFIDITDELLWEYARITRPQVVVINESAETPVDESAEHPLLEDARELVFKMRSFMEDSSGDYALGVETGMQRAADMIENLIRRYEKGDDLER